MFYLVASNGLEAPEFLAEIRQPNGMMEDPVSAEVVRVGPTNDTYQRQVLTIRAGDRVDHAQPPNGERDNTRAYATAPRVPIGGIPGVEFVAAPDHVELRLRYEVVEKRKVEVAGNGEHVGDPDLYQPPCKVAAKCCVGGTHRRRG